MKYYILISNNLNADKHLDINNLQENINNTIGQLEREKISVMQYVTKELLQSLQFYELLNKYLTIYKSIYEKELDCILTNLPNICESNISTKKIFNNDNEENLIDLINDEFVKVD